jgi:uncharacterized small protein (DUF1192 family)
MRSVDSKAQPVTMLTEMELDERMCPLGDSLTQLVSEPLDLYSHAELTDRVAALENEIARVMAHRKKVSAQRTGAEALFKRLNNCGPNR